MASEVVRSEVQVLRTESTAVNSSVDSVAGNFRLSWGEDGEETDYLPADVGEVELEAALEGIKDVRDVQVGMYWTNNSDNVSNFIATARLLAFILVCGRNRLYHVKLSVNEADLLLSHAVVRFKSILSSAAVFGYRPAPTAGCFLFPYDNVVVCFRLPVWGTLPLATSGP